MKLDLYLLLNNYNNNVLLKDENEQKYSDVWPCVIMCVTKGQVATTSDQSISSSFFHYCISKQSYILLQQVDIFGILFSQV